MDISNYYRWITRSSAFGMQAKAACGGLPGKAPLGYKNCRLGRRAWVELDPETAPLVQEAFYWAAEGKYSLRKILEKMTEKGMVSTRGRPLTVSSLHFLLTNPFYVGRVCFKGEVSQGLHPALVDLVCFERVQRNLEKRQRNGNGGEKELPLVVNIS